MPSRTIELALSKSSIEDQVAALLYAIGVVKDNEEVLGIDFGTFSNGTVPLKIKIKKDQEVKLIKHYDG